VSVALAETAQSPRYVAAAAAVATALATQSMPVASPEFTGAWNLVVRAQQLAGRRVYDARRK